MKKLRKNMVKRMISASAIMGTAISMAVFPSYAVNADNINSKGNIVLEDGDGDVALYAADADYLYDEINNLYQELPEISNSTYYGTPRKSELNSKGIIDYANGTVLIDSSDFFYLADEIDSLEAEFKANTVEALNAMGTFFLADGSINHVDENLDEAAVLSFETIYEGIKQSQSVDHLAEQGITASIENNLSKGTAAWVDGELIIGNGADNTAYYNQGFIDGQLSLYDKTSISYVYHEHEGTPFVTGGCVSAWHTHTSNCAYHYANRCDGSTSCINHGHKTCDYWPYNAWCLFGCINGHTFWAEHTDNVSCTYCETIYDCGNSPLNQWSYTCRKTTSTIESATIVFNN